MWKVKKVANGDFVVRTISGSIPSFFRRFVRRATRRFTIVLLVSGNPAPVPMRHNYEGKASHVENPAAG
jgi:hypothetical protein